MISRYEIFCMVIESGSFTRTAEKLGYSQSAISQTIKSLEQEFETALVNRQKGQITLTADGQSYMPYLRAIATAEGELKEKHREMSGLQNAAIRIGAFTSIGQHLLPPLMKQFKQKYPSVHFILQQGDYTDIHQWVREGSVDLGFINTRAVNDLNLTPLHHDQMMAILPVGHPLALQPVVSLKQLASEPFIMLDEGEYSLTLEAFSKEGLKPRIEYEVADDYLILAMIRQGLGISLLYQLVLSDDLPGVVIRPIKEVANRTIALAWRNWETLPIAARGFGDFILKHTKYKA